MANIDSHSVGAFCWIELATTDQAAAKNFYQTLFGWKVNDIPMGPGDFYSIFRLHDRDVSAAYTLRPDQRSQGVPPHWMLYVSVENADRSAARAAELGGKVVAPAFDVMEAGRMAVIADPTGAVLSVWQPKKHAGTGITGVAGTLCWADLSTPDAGRAGEFYSGLFNWKLMAETDDKPATAGYLHIKNGDEFIGGIPPSAHRDPRTPPHWLVYFLVSNCDATAAKAKELGAQSYLGPMTMEGVGRMAILADPQQAVFAIFEAAAPKAK